MCIRILIVDVLPGPVRWDPDDVTILVRRGSCPGDAMQEIRAILADLDAPPAVPFGALCFCGDPIPLPREVSTLPQRIATTGRQVLRGA